MRALTSLHDTLACDRLSAGCSAELSEASLMDLYACLGMQSL